MKSLFAPTELADFLQTPPANQKSPVRASGNPPCAQIRRPVAGPALLPCAISPAPQEALQYPAATFPPNARAKTAHKKTQLPVADTPDPLAAPPERIVQSPP